MPIAVTDPRNNTTTITYDTLGLFPASVQHPATNVIAHTDYYNIDDNTGNLNWHTDQNSNTTHYYYDSMWRLTKVVDPPTQSGSGETDYCYTDIGGATCPATGPPYSVYTTTLAMPNPSQTSIQAYDGLGRVIKNIAPSGAITDTTYDANDRVYSVSNPYISTSDPTYGITYFTYDALGRKTIQTQQDGTSKLQWCYDGIQTTGQTNCRPLVASVAGEWVDYADESTNDWQHVTDSLGRLVSVVEPNGVSHAPTMETDYGYDILNNLLSVTQWGGPVGTPGARSRSFTYDSLSRLLTATNPESGLVSYTYDAGGNMTDAREITVTKTYDALNRVLTSTAPGINDSYYYDQATEGTFTASNPIGRLVWSTNNVNADKHYSYDAMGRVIYQTGCTPTNCASGANPVAAQYDLAGNIAFLTYPDGRTVSQTLDGAGRLSTVNYYNWNGTSIGSNYLTANSYDAPGHLISATMGNGVAISASYNNPRLELSSLKYGPNSSPLWSKQYAWMPNGNLQQTADMVAGTTRQYSYDTLNRLLGAQDVITGTQNQPTDGLNESYSYDPFGNLQQSGNFSFVQAYTTANWISGYSYDVAGNLLADGLGNTYTWNADGMLSSSNGTSYFYDAEGDRVGKSGSAPTDTIYFGGRPVARLAGGAWTDLIYGAGGLLAEVPGTQTGAPVYRMTDNLGSSVGTLTLTGALSGGIQDYAPFGELFNGSSTSDPYKFTGKERDTESGNDYFGARYFGFSMGRFLSPDPLGPWVADVNDPQSWNFYAYGRNNPLINIDPTGLDCLHFNSDNSLSRVDRQLDPQSSHWSLNQQANYCGNHGGNWVNGHYDSMSPSFSGEGFSVFSHDANGHYRTDMTVPGQQTNGTFCSGNCAYDYSGPPRGSDDDDHPYAIAIFGQVQQMTATFYYVSNKVPECVAEGAEPWVGIPTPQDAQDARDVMFGDSHDLNNPITSTGVEAADKTLDKYSRVSKFAKVGGKALGKVGKVMAAQSTYKNMKKAGCFGGKAK
jgi:RHS repeat-associated protein